MQFISYECIAGEVGSNCQLVGTFFFLFFFDLTIPNQRLRVVQTLAHNDKNCLYA